MSQHHSSFLTQCLALSIALHLAGCNDSSSPAEQELSAATQPQVDVDVTPNPDSLPKHLSKSFTDHVPAFSDGNNNIPFQMLLIPGDKSRGIEPFYIAETEVTWGMMKDWMYQVDLIGQELTYRERAEIENKGQRPSPIYGDLVNILLADDAGRPAAGVSWRTAETYCAWLSQQTGRTYRLPTDEEWMHVFELSGGVASEQVLADQAVFADTGGDNIEKWGEPYFRDHVTRPVKSKRPNKLGLYDFLGNVAEWVQPTSEERWVRGGHFMLKTNEFNRDWRGIEDQEVWNESYPQIPRSQSWYFDQIFPGLRLVCEVESVDQE